MTERHNKALERFARVRVDVGGGDQRFGVVNGQQQVGERLFVQIASGMASQPFGDEIRDNLRNQRYPRPRLPFFDLGAAA